MKKLNKKGFTIVELVIVIAVIAILAGVLIPTFSSIIEKANQSAALQEATNTYRALLTEEPYKGNLDLNQDGVDLYIKITKSNKTYWFKVVNGEISLVEGDITISKPYEALDEGNYTEDYTNVYVYTPTPTN